ncbi:ankyrin repeats (3 copies) domain-containing protein [Pochonia chlamydosporia 170]|uniref:Ankyrin repeats (3 copies) domain-containing protein n=1 Tax=Pochonia chlamydosporia 170 TaxID=1380566 RepID=A0A179FB20_METCM|nr:ankyrin repeats (3 copies) domain-containing protein [Pochonia chlamydosporia 170]OAQ62662.1 ankyrin repeats (3 copies) domain-containing protein [Pochonia chlamydosporia 170]
MSRLSQRGNGNAEKSRANVKITSAIQLQPFTSLERAASDAAPVDDTITSTLIKSHVSTKTAMELASLPTELLMHITKALDRDCDINAFCRVSRGFYNLIVDYLYRHNATAQHGEASAILWAAKHGQRSTAEMALQAGVDINTPQDNAGTLPLVEATRVGNAALVRLFLERGAHSNVLHGRAGTILHTAAARWDMKTATALLEYSANVQVQRLDNGETPLHTAINSGAIMTGGPTEMIKLLLDHGADVAGTDFVGATPLHCAAACGNIAAIHTLLDYGAGSLLSTRGSHIETPLHSAVRARNEEAAKVLIESGADIEATDRRGLTVIWHAIKFKCTGTLEILLHKGANTNCRDSVGNAPLISAITGGNLAAVKALLTYDAGLKTDPALGARAILLATMEGRADMIQMLVDAGVDIHGGPTPALHGAVLAGHDEVIHVLLRNGADVNGTDEENHTALHWAALHGCSSAAEILFANGADPMIRADDGGTPVDFAERGGDMCYDVYRLIIRYLQGN